MAAARVIVHSLRTSEWSGELDSVFFGRSLVRITGSSDAGICLNSHVLFTPSYLGGRVSFLYLFEYLRGSVFASYIQTLYNRTGLLSISGANPCGKKDRVKRI